MNDADEVARLRARVAELEAQLTTQTPTLPLSTPSERSKWWAASSALLITLACVLAPLSVTAVWVSTQLSETDQYVATVAPIADDPGVQTAIAAEVTDAVLDALDIEDVITQALQSLAQLENVPPRVADTLPGLAVPISNGVENFTRTQVNKAVASPQFAAVWEEVNRIAHEQVINLLEGTQGGTISARSDTITLNLAPIIERVKERLVAEGLTIANRIPTIDRSFVLVQSDAIPRAQGVYQLLNTLGSWLPIIALAMFAGGVYFAKDRRQALLRGALGVAGALLVLGVGLATVRLLYMNSTPADVFTSETAGSVFDTLVRFLRTGLRATAVLALIVALAAFMTGPSAPARRGRTAIQRGIGSLRGSAEAAGWQTGRFGSWIYTHKRALRFAVLITAGMILLFWTRATASVVVLSALAAVLALAIIEFLGRPPVPVAAATGEAVVASPVDHPPG